MNHDIDDHIPSFGDPAREREWLAQEQAMRRERLHLDPAHDDPRMRRYRLLARALREPLQDTLPVDFARHVAAQVNAQPIRQPLAGTRLELVLTFVLGIIFVLAAGTVTLIYGSAWLPSISAALPAPDPSATRWLLAFAGCIGTSWLLGTWQQRGHGR
ncbi:MAG: hypothetical protein ACREPQ_03245 [Rhodanobacter sp.]